MSKRYFLARDNSAHWYVVPVDQRGAWDDWCDLPEDDERSWEAPDYARRLNSGPEHVTFCNPRLP